MKDLREKFRPYAHATDVVDGVAETNNKIWNDSVNQCVQIAETHAKDEAIGFSEWLQQNRWFTFQNGYWYYTFEYAIAISDEAYNKKYRKTTSELYEIYQQQKEKL